MNQIIIASPPYNPSIGGVVVLHKLCHILNELGYNSSLIPTQKLAGGLYQIALNPEYNTKLTTEIIPDEDIIIYPEIQEGNPWGINKVVRWILNSYHIPTDQNYMASWGEKDYWLYYDDIWYDGFREKNMLYVRETKIEKFKNYNIERDIEACFTLRKKHHLKDSLIFVHPEDAIEIPYSIPDEELIQLFNKSKRFYCYDTESYLSELASLCGCESIVVPHETAKFNETPRWGVAYGVENIQFALDTREKMIEEMIQSEQNNFSNAKIALDKVFKHFNLIYNG
jgi:hypothetical protein